MKCGGCGARNPRGNQFCVQCGAQLEPAQAEPAKQTHPPDAEGAQKHLEQAFRLSDEGQLAEAIEACRQATVANPFSTSAHSFLGILYERAGDREQAVREYELALSLSPESAAERASLEQLTSQTGAAPAIPAPSRRLVRTAIIAGFAAVAVILAVAIFLTYGRGPAVTAGVQPRYPYDVPTTVPTVTADEEEPSPAPRLARLPTLPSYPALRSPLQPTGPAYRARPQPLPPPKPPRVALPETGRVITWRPPAALAGPVVPRRASTARRRAPGALELVPASPGVARQHYFERQYGKAIEVYQRMLLLRPDASATVREELAWVYYQANRTRDALGQYRRALDGYERQRARGSDPEGAELGIRTCRAAIEALSAGGSRCQAARDRRKGAGGAMVRGLRLALTAGAALAILSAVPALSQQEPPAHRFTVLVLPVSSPDPGLRPLAAQVLDAVHQGLRDQGAPGQTVLVFRRSDPAVQRALREHPYLELPPGQQISPALADALGWALRIDTTISGTLTAEGETARLTLRASGVRSRIARQHAAQAAFGPEVLAGAVPGWASDLVAAPVEALASQLPALAAAAPVDPEAHFREGERLFAQGDYAQAVVEYDMASAASPQDPNYYIALAKAYRALGDLHTALLEVRRALRLDPDLVPALVMLGEVYAGLDRPEPALQAFQQAALADPESGDALRGLVRVYTSQGQREMALAQQERLLALDPEDLDAVLAAGGMAEGLGRWSQAADYYRRAAALEPERADLRQRLIDLHRRRGDWAAAVAALKQVQDSGVEMRYDAAEFVRLARVLEGEAEAIIEAAQAQAQAHRSRAPGRRPSLDSLRRLRQRADVLALTAEALVPPQPLVPGHRHRVLALHQLNQATYELLRYAQTRLRERHTRSLLLADAAQKELDRARELDADAGWPALAAGETETVAESPAP